MRLPLLFAASLSRLFSEGRRINLGALPFTVVGKGTLDHAPKVIPCFLSISGEGWQHNSHHQLRKAQWMSLVSCLCCLPVVKGKMHGLALPGK